MVAARMAACLGLLVASACSSSSSKGDGPRNVHVDGPTLDGSTNFLDPDPGAEGGIENPASVNCDTYLSCVLAESPQAYAAALQLYGQNSACWANSTQSANCEKACQGAYAEVSYLCECTGTQCQACSFPAANTWYSVPDVDAGPDPGEVVLCSGYALLGGSNLMLEYEPLESRSASIDLPVTYGPGETIGDLPEVTLTGSFGCGGPWVATGTSTSPNQTWTATFTPTDSDSDGGTASLSVSLKFDGVPADGGSPITCTDSFVVTSTGP
jgi:hypothetical protein